MEIRNLMVFALTSALLDSPVHGAVPQLIRYQGQAVDSQGTPLEELYTLTFKLYTAATNGTIVWQEPHPNVVLSGGHFSVLLGDTQSLQGVDWTQPLWFGVQVNSDPELEPRQQITSVPLAITAEKLAVPVTTSTITDDANRLVPSGAVILWTSAACPTGYSRLSSMDGAMLKAGSASSGPNTAGAAELPTHSHTVSGSTSTDGTHRHNLSVEKDTGGETALASTVPNVPMANGMNYISDAGSHSHSFSGGSSTSGTATVATVLLCQKN